MSDPQYVYSSDGRRGVIIRDLDPSNDDRRYLRVRFDDSPELTVPAELLELRADGAFDLNVGHRELIEAPNAGPRRQPDSRSGQTDAERAVETGGVHEHEEVVVDRASPPAASLSRDRAAAGRPDLSENRD
jgi:hypothetical protein